MKHCADCHFARNKTLTEVDWKCRSPKNVATKPTGETFLSLITGDPLPQFDTCSAARSHGATGCGYDAVWFLTTQQYLGALGGAGKVTMSSKVSSSSKIGLGDL